MNIAKADLTKSIMDLFAENDRLTARNKELEGLMFGDADLWCVKLISLDRLLAMRSLEVAQVRALEINVSSMHGEIAEVVRSPWPLDVHLKNCLQVTETWLQGANEQIEGLRQTIATLSALGNPE